MADLTPLTRDAGTAGQLLIPQNIQKTLIEAVSKKLVGRELAAHYYGPNSIPGTSTYVNLVTADSMKVFRVSEGAAIPMDTPDYTAVEIKPVKYAVRPLITSEMMEDSQFQQLTHAIKIAGVEMAENENELIEAALDQATNTVAGGASATLNNINRAIQYLEDSDFEGTDMIVGPEFANDLRNIDTFVEAAKFGNREMLSNGYIGSLLGMRVHRVSGNIFTTTSAWVFDRNEAFAIGEKRPVTVKNYDDVIRDMSGATITQRVTAKILRADAVAKITTS